MIVMSDNHSYAAHRPSAAQARRLTGLNGAWRLNDLNDWNTREADLALYYPDCKVKQ